MACVLRPENFTLKEPGRPSNVLEGVVEWMAFVGPYVEARINIGRAKLLVDFEPDTQISLGERVRVYIPNDEVIILPLKAPVAYA